MTPERLHELEHCIEQIADPVIAEWMGELWDALQAAEARIAELTATVEGQRLALEEMERKHEILQRYLNEQRLYADFAATAYDLEETRTRLAVYRQWAEEARLKLSGAQAYLAMLGKPVIADDIQSFLTHPLPGEEDR